MSKVCLVFRSFPRRRESSQLTNLDSRLRGNERFMNFIIVL
jgi:hypothetical protein